MKKLGAIILASTVLFSSANAMAQNRNSRDPFQSVCTTSDNHTRYVQDSTEFICTGLSGNDWTLAQLFARGYKIISYATSYMDVNNTVTVDHIIVIEKR